MIILSHLHQPLCCVTLQSTFARLLTAQTLLRDLLTQLNVLMYTHVRNAVYKLALLRLSSNKQINSVLVAQRLGLRTFHKTVVGLFPAAA